eukprot:2789824-Amphidinium_carterae.3
MFLGTIWCSAFHQEALLALTAIETNTTRPLHQSVWKSSSSVLPLLLFDSLCSSLACPWNARSNRSCFRQGVLRLGSLSRLVEVVKHSLAWSLCHLTSLDCCQRENMYVKKTVSLLCVLRSWCASVGFAAKKSLSHTCSGSWPQCPCSKVVGSSLHCIAKNLGCYLLFLPRFACAGQSVLHVFFLAAIQNLSCK